MPRKSPSIINQLFTNGEGKKTLTLLDLWFLKKFKKQTPTLFPLKYPLELNIIWNIQTSSSSAAVEFFDHSAIVGLKLDSWKSKLH